MTTKSITSRPFFKVLAVSVISLFSVLCVAESTAPTLIQPPVPPPSSLRLTPKVMAVKQALPWVVNIGTNEKIIQINDPFSLFFTEFFNRQRHVSTTTQYSPLGSGVIVDSRGLVLTNSHVVRRAQQIEIRLWDGKAYPATVVGFDAPNDLCLLQIIGEGTFQAANFAHANDLLLGESVIAIGNPFGLEHSVSDGTLSAFNRSFHEGDVAFSDIIQTDAAINPGNSGGPLINLDGQLIGINLAIRSDAQGIGFAIPLARIELFLSYWLKPSHFSDGYLGFAPDAAIPQCTAGGVVLPKLLPDSPLTKAGLKEGDVIKAINGKVIRRQIDFGRAIWTLKADDQAIFTTANNKDYKVKLTHMPASLLFRTRLGLKLQELTPAIRKAMGVPKNLEGLMVSEVISEPFFSMQDAQWRQVVKRGDIIVHFDNQKITSCEQLAKILSGTRSGDTKQLGLFSFGHRRRQYVPLVVNHLLLN